MLSGFQKSRSFSFVGHFTSSLGFTTTTENRSQRRLCMSATATQQQLISTSGVWSYPLEIPRGTLPPRRIVPVSKNSLLRGSERATPSHGLIMVRSTGQCRFQIFFRRWYQGGISPWGVISQTCGVHPIRGMRHIVPVLLSRRWINPIKLAYESRRPDGWLIWQPAPLTE